MQYACNRPIAARSRALPAPRAQPFQASPPSHARIALLSASTSHASASHGSYTIPSHNESIGSEVPTGVSRRGLLLSTAVLTSALMSGEAAFAGDDKLFFDLKLEGVPIGRIVIELFDDVKLGSARFRDLAVGKEGVGYRLSRFDGIFDTHLRVAGVRQLSYSVSGESAIAGGDSVAELEAEMESATHLHTEAGLVSLSVLEADERPITEKVVAKGGKLVTIQNQAGESPNGTGFIITRSAAPDLDRTNLVIGRVVEGMDVVATVAALPFSKPRVEWYDGPFFEAGKAMGDKRAVVAEKGFNRPFKRVIVVKSGIL